MAFQSYVSFEPSFKPADAESRAWHFHRNLRQALYHARMAERAARQGGMLQAVDYLKWAWWHAGKVSALGYAHTATSAMLRRADICRQICSWASGNVMMALAARRT